MGFAQIGWNDRYGHAQCPAERQHSRPIGSVHEWFPMQRFAVGFGDVQIRENRLRSLDGQFSGAFLVLDYFDSFLVGLTATPDNRTYGFFKNNVVSDYSHEKAVA